MAGRFAAAALISPGRLALHSMLWLLMFSLVAKGASFFKEIALAHRFGVGPITDAYVLGFSWATWLPGIFASLAMATLVPTVATLSHRSPAEGDLFTREFAGVTLVAGFCVAVLTALAPVTLVPLAEAAGYRIGPSLATTLPALAWLVPAFFIASFGSTRLVAEHRHANLALEAVPALVLTGVLLLPDELTLWQLCIGTSAGYLLYAAAVLVLMKRDGQPLRIRFGFRSEGWHALAGASVALVIGNVCAGSLVVVDQVQAATLGAGGASTLGFASRLLLLPAVLLSLMITRAMLPIFAQMHARRDTAALDALVYRSVLAAFAVGAIGALAIWVLAPVLVSTAFERGSFTAADSRHTAEALRWGILQLPCYLASIVLVQALLSRRRFGAVAASGVFNLLAKIAFNAWLAPLMGVNGITLATSIVLSLSFLILLSRFRVRDRAAR